MSPAREVFACMDFGFRKSTFIEIFPIRSLVGRFTQENREGYRDICVNLEVGWTIDSERSDELTLVDVIKFSQKYKNVRTHICEVR